MSEPNNAEVFAKIEDEIKNGLSGDVQKNALDFTTFLRANDFSANLKNEHGGWSIPSNGRIIVGLHVISDENVFGIILNTCNFSGDPVDDDVKEFAWAHVALCQCCDRATSCEMSQKNVTIFGKEFASICIAPLECFNLNADELKKVQKLVLMLK